MDTVNLQWHGDAIAHQEANDLVAFCYTMIAADGKSVPPQQRDWKIGYSFSWHYVRIVEYRAAQLFKSIEDITMATKRGKSRVQNTQETYAFVKCELNSEDKKSAKVWIEENTTELGAMLHDAMANGYKFTCSFSSEHDTFTACLVGKPEEAVNAYKTLTARHKDWTMACLTVLYKHLVIFRGEVWETDVDTADDGWA